MRSRVQRLCSRSGYQLLRTHGWIVDVIQDLLWKMKATPGLNFDTMHEIPVVSINKRLKMECVAIGTDLDDMLALATDHNFVPVVDDYNNRVFLGIIRRKDIIEYYTWNITD